MVICGQSLILRGLVVREDNGMNSVKGWIRTNLSRRGFIILAALGLYQFILQSMAWARANSHLGKPLVLPVRLEKV